MAVDNSTSFGTQLDNYYSEIPFGTAQAVGKSIVYTFAVVVILSSNIHRATVCAGVAALASTIHSLTAPAFGRLFNQERSSFKDGAKVVIDLVITQLLVNRVTPYKMDLIVAAPLHVCWAILFPSKTKTYIIF